MEVVVGLDFQVFAFTWKTVTAVSWARFILDHLFLFALSKLSIAVRVKYCVSLTSRRLRYNKK